MTVEIISWSISTKVWDRTGIELATPGSAVRHASVARHVTDCTTRPEKVQLEKQDLDEVIVVADLDEDARSEVLEKIPGSHKDSEKILITFFPTGYYFQLICPIHSMEWNHLNNYQRGSYQDPIPSKFCQNLAISLGDVFWSNHWHLGFTVSQSTGLLVTRTGDKNSSHPLVITSEI